MFSGRLKYIIKKKKFLSHWLPGKAGKGWCSQMWKKLKSRVYFLSWPESSNHFNFGSLCLSWAVQSQKMIRKISEGFLLLANLFCIFKQWMLVLESAYRTLTRTVRIEPSDHENSEYVNGHAKCLATPFSADRGPIRGGGDCGTQMATSCGNSSTSGVSQKWQISHGRPCNTYTVLYSTEWLENFSFKKEWFI